MRVAVLGAGYAGLTIALRLEETLPETVNLVVVDESPDHLIQHELHRVVRRPAVAETITIPLEDVLSRADVRQARVTDVDPEAGRATLETADATDDLSYDAAAVCLGAVTDYHDIPGVRDHAIPLKRLEHARRIRRAALAAANDRFAIGGAGLSGVQVAGELVALSREEDLDLDVRLVEMADRVAPTFGEEFGEAIRSELEARSVTVETGVAVERADDAAVSLADGRRLPYDVFVWTGGICGPDALHGERVPVAADLRYGDATFVVGDAGTVTDDSGHRVPASAQTAIRQARVAAKNVVRAVNAATVEDESTTGDDAPRYYEYHFDEPGWVVSVGDGAVAQLGPVVLSGEPARAAKALVGAGHLSSIGAVDNAADLVAEELGWPASNATGRLVALLPQRVFDDAAVLGIQNPTVERAFLDLADSVVPGDDLDLTRWTRLSDRHRPGSPANLFQRTVGGSVDRLLGVRRARIDNEGGDDHDAGAEDE